MSTVEQTRTPILRREDTLIVHALANGASYKEAAEQTGVSRSTVARRMKDDEFRALVDAERDLVINQTRDLLAQASPGAADTMIALAATAASETVRLAAARAVVELALSRRPGLAWMDASEFARFVDRLIEASIDFVPAEMRVHWLTRVSEIGERGW
jgi:AraC-like DNA-binding protein